MGGRAGKSVQDRVYINKVVTGRQNRESPAQLRQLRQLRQTARPKTSTWSNFFGLFIIADNHFDMAVGYFFLLAVLCFELFVYIEGVEYKKSNPPPPRAAPTGPKKNKDSPKYSFPSSQDRVDVFGFHVRSFS